MRSKIILLAGAATLAMVFPAGAEQGAPVEFATDPGAAHPRYIEEALATGSDARTPLASNSSMPVEAMMASEPGFETVDRAQIEATAIAAPADRGGFDYGYASNEVELAGAASASSGPTVLVNDAPPPSARITEQPAPQAATYQQIALQQSERQASPYQSDPIYRVAETSEALPADARGMIRVQPGDTIYALGRRYGISPNAIIEANDIAPPYSLQIGQMIRIPGLGTQSESLPRTAQAAPVEAAQAQPIAQPVAASAPATATQNRIYVVRPGNTLYSIARAYGYEVEIIAAANRMAPPYTLSVGQQLIIPGNRQIVASNTAPTTSVPEATVTPPGATSLPANRNTYIEPQPSIQREATAAQATETPQTVSYAVPEASPDSRFSWPLQGMVIMGYGLGSDGRRNDGINIAAPIGTPIRAVDDGEVVYRGSDLEGYGNLLLVKHTGGWVSAYAHTDAMLVRKGETVRKGQVIAKVGTTGTVDQPQLHFELRHDLKPTDPLAALDGRNELAIR